MQKYDINSSNQNQVNEYIPFDTGTAELEQAFLNDLKDKRIRAEQLERSCNTWERISEQLGVLHAQLTGSEVRHA